MMQQYAQSGQYGYYGAKVVVESTIKATYGDAVASTGIPPIVSGTLQEAIDKAVKDAKNLTWKNPGTKKTSIASTISNNVYSDYTNQSPIDSLFMLSYADDTTDYGTVDGEEPNMFKILNKKINNEFLFKLDGVNISIYNGEQDIVQTIIDNNYIVCVEPIFMCGMEVWWSGECYYFGHLFYGTPTNFIGAYGGFNDYGWFVSPFAETSILAFDAYKSKYVVNPGPVVEYTNKSTLAMSAPDLSGTLTGDDLGGCNIGWGVGMFYVGGGGDPESRTYNPVFPNPYGTPAEGAPFPIISRWPHFAPTFNTKKMKEDEREKYQYKIIKVYDKLTLDNELEHVISLQSGSEPGKIYIQHEPAYKVVEYFTGQDLFDYTVTLHLNIEGDFSNLTEKKWIEFINGGMTSDITDKEWEFFKSEVPTQNNNFSNNGEDNIAVFNRVRGEKADTLATDGTTPNPVIFGKGTDYDKDTVLYVHLIKTVEPTTHTWDEPNYPNDPGPAPDPKNDPDPNYPLQPLSDDSEIIWKGVVYMLVAFGSGSWPV